MEQQPKQRGMVGWIRFQTVDGRRFFLHRATLRSIEEVADGTIVTVHNREQVLVTALFDDVLDAIDAADREIEEHNSPKPKMAPEQPARKAKSS